MQLARTIIFTFFALGSLVTAQNRQYTRNYDDLDLRHIDIYDQDTNPYGRNYADLYERDAGPYADRYYHLYRRVKGASNQCSKAQAELVAALNNKASLEAIKAVQMSVAEHEMRLQAIKGVVQKAKNAVDSLCKGQ